MTEEGGGVGADRIGRFRRPACLLLDDPFQEADDEGDARCFHRLQIDRRQQNGLVATRPASKLFAAMASTEPMASPLALPT